MSKHYEKKAMHALRAPRKFDKIFQAIAESAEDPFLGHQTRNDGTRGNAAKSAADAEAEFFDGWVPHREGIATARFPELSNSGVDPFLGWKTQSSSPSDLIGAIKRQIVPLLLIPMVAVLLGLGYNVWATPLYSSAALIRYIGAETDTEALSTSLVSHIESLRAPSVVEKVIEQAQLENSIPVQRGRLHEAVWYLRRALDADLSTGLTEAERQVLLNERVQESLNVRRLEDAPIIEVSYSSENPEQSAQLANMFASVYLDRLAEERSADTQFRVAFLRSRVAELEELATSAYQNVRQLQQDSRLEFGGLEDLEARLTQLTDTLSDLRETEATLDARLSLINVADDVTSLEAAALQSEDGTELLNAYLQARGTLDKLKQDGAVPRSIAQFDRTVTQYREALDQLVQQTQSRLQQELKVLSARREIVEKDFERALDQNSSPSWSGIWNAEYQATVLQDLYAQHLRELEVVYEVGETEPLRIMTSARPRVEPSWPDYKLVLLLAGVLGMLAGILAAALREWNRASRHSLVTRFVG